jgi:hypothetical protein
MNYKNVINNPAIFLFSVAISKLNHHHSVDIEACNWLYLPVYDMFANQKKSVLFKIYTYKTVCSNLKYAVKVWILFLRLSYFSSILWCFLLWNSQYCDVHAVGQQSQWSSEYRRVSWWPVRASWVCRRSWALKRLSRSCDSVVRVSCNCKRLGCV